MSPLRTLHPQILFDLHEIYYLLSTAEELSLQDKEIFAYIQEIPQERLDDVPAVLWRIQALQQQVPHTGPIIFTPLFQFIPQKGQCDLCNQPLCQGERFHCVLCSLAMRLILGYQTLYEWLVSEQCDRDLQKQTDVNREGAQRENTSLPDLESDEMSATALFDE